MLLIRKLEPWRANVGKGFFSKRVMGAVCDDGIKYDCSPDCAIGVKPAMTDRYRLSTSRCADAPRCLRRKKSVMRGMGTP